MRQEPERKGAQITVELNVVKYKKGISWSVNDEDALL
jgi:hypothetical protein